MAKQNEDEEAPDCATQDTVDESLQAAIHELSEATGERVEFTPELLKTAEKHVDELMDAVDPNKHVDELVNAVDRMMTMGRQPTGKPKKRR